MRSGLTSRIGESLGALAGVFRVADLRRLAFAYLTSLLALWAYSVVIAVYAFEIGGATLVGVAAVVRLIPSALVAPFAAAVVDRYPKRRVLVITDLLRAALIGAAAAAVAADVPAAVVFAIAALNGMVGTVFHPAKGALLPGLASDPDQLTAANTAMSTFESSAIFAGPALGGLVLAFGSIQLAFALVGVMLIFSAAQAARIRHETADRIAASEESEGWLTEATAGFRAIRSNGDLRTMVGLFGAQVLTDGFLGVAIVTAAFDLLHRGEAWVGYLNAAIGVGGLIGGVATLALTGRRGLGAVFGLGLVAWGLPLTLLGIFPGPVAALILLGVVGIANTVVDASVTTLLQRSASEEVLGRVFGVLESVIIGALAIGALAAPALVSLLGIKGALIAGGLLLPVLALLTRPTLRRVDAAVAPPTHRLDRLRAIPMFAPLGPVELERIALSLGEESHHAGEEIIRQGDRGESFFIIDVGEVDVLEGERLAQTECAGDHFGEIALIRDIPRTATVTARTDIRLLVLGREQFLAAINRDRLSVQAAEAVVAARLGAG